MAGTDNILAAIAGLTKGVENVFLPYTQAKTKFTLEDELARRNDERSQIPIETISGATGKQFPNVQPGTRIPSALLPYMTEKEEGTTTVLDENLKPAGTYKGKVQFKPSSMQAVYDSEGNIISYVPKGSKQVSTGQKSSRLTSSEIKSISLANDVIAEIETNVANLKKNKFGVTPYNPANYGMLKRTRGSDFQAFAADTDRAFQKYRSATTGAQAPYAELAYLEQDLPSVKDNPETYVKKAEGVIKQFKNMRNRYVKTLQKSGRSFEDEPELVTPDMFTEEVSPAPQGSGLSPEQRRARIAELRSKMR